MRHLRVHEPTQTMDDAEKTDLVAHVASKYVCKELDTASLHAVTSALELQSKIRRFKALLNNNTSKGDLSKVLELHEGIVQDQVKIRLAHWSTPYISTTQRAHPVKPRFLVHLRTNTETERWQNNCNCGERQRPIRKPILVAVESIRQVKQMEPLRECNSRDIRYLDE